MKLSERIRNAKLYAFPDWDLMKYLDDLYRLALKFEDAERDVTLLPLKTLEKTARKYYKACGKNRSGATYIATNGRECFECRADYVPKKDEAVFKFTTSRKVKITPYRWSGGKYIVIENNGKH